MALTVLTLRPTSTGQLGVGTVTGAANAHTALSDDSDSSYVQIATRCRLDSQVVRVGFATPTLPAGAKVFSVGLRRRVLAVASGSPRPVCHHWLRCAVGAVQVAGQAQRVVRGFFSTPCPATPTATWVQESLGSVTTAPDGTGWDPATNLTGLSYELGRGDDDSTNLRVSEVYLDVTYQQASTVAATGPTGTVATTRPIITWTYGSPDSQPQQAYRVAVYTAAQVAASGFVAFDAPSSQESGWLLGEDQRWPLASDLVDGSYTAYIQVSTRWAGPGEFPSAIASTTWTRSVATGGGQPPNAVLSSAVFDSANNRVQLTMAPGGGSPATAAFTVEVSRDAGVTWIGIPSLTLVAANGMTPVVRHDYVAPIGISSRYRVMAYSQPGGGPYVAAVGYSSVATVTTFGDDWWLKDPGNPLLNTVLPVKGDGKGEGKSNKITRKRVQGTFQVLSGSGEVYPVVVSGPVYAEEATLELFFRVDHPGDYWTSYDQLDRSGHVLLLQKPFGDQLWIVLGPGSGGQDTELTYDVIPGRSGRVQWRRVQTSYTAVTAPAYY